MLIWIGPCSVYESWAAARPGPGGVPAGRLNWALEARVPNPKIHTLVL